jgi:hypothetical protein
MKEKIFLLAPVTTIVLAIAFLTPIGPGTRTAYQSVSGKTWSMRQPEPTLVPAVNVAVSTAAPASAPVPAARKDPRPSVRSRRLRSVALSSKAVVVQHVPAETHPSAAPIPSTVTVASAPAAPRPPTGSAPDYALEDIADRFENDESKFPLERSIEAGGVTLHLVGLEKLPAMYVLKVAVINSADADFFIKGFTVTAGSQILSSRPIFRILVEPQRTREGYVLFEKPQTGMTVKINLKEDAGKGRSLETTIPYPF